MNLAKLDEDIRKLDEELAELKKERVAQGLPAERPASFVSMELTEVLLERVWPLRNAIIKYASLVGASEMVLPLKVDKLREKYSEDLTLLQESVGVCSSLTARTMLNSLNIIEEALNAEEREASDLLRELYINIALFVSKPSIKDLIYYDSPEEISDEGLAKAHYDSIKHLI